MYEILVNKVGQTTYAEKVGGGVVANITEIATLVEGNIMWFEKNGAKIDDAVPAPTDNYVYLAVGRAAGSGSVISEPIDRTANLQYNKQAYQAPVAQVAAIGSSIAGSTSLLLNLPATLVEGTVVEVLIDLEATPWYETTRRERFEYTVQSGDVDQDVVDGLVAKINDDLNWADGVALVTAAAVNTDDGITITADTAGQGFKIGVRGILGDADISYGAIIAATGLNAGTAAIINDVYYDDTTTPTLATKCGTATMATRVNIIGNGTPTQGQDIYDMTTAESGNTSTKSDGQSLWSVPTPIESAATYTVYTIQWDKLRRNNSHNVSNSDQQTLVVLIPSANAATITDMDNILAAL